MNLFEGARRFAMIVAGLWTLGILIVGFTIEKSVYVYYKYPNFGSEPQLSEGTCDDLDATEYGLKNFATSKGTNINVSLCFAAVSGFEGGKKLVPYKMDTKTGVIWGAHKYSTEVSTYKKELAATFQLPPKDYETLDKKANSKWWTDVKDLMLMLFGGLLCIYAFTFAVGWVVRGFMGIPRGSDSKAK